jgi:hypothetical protein
MLKSSECLSYFLLFVTLLFLIAILPFLLISCGAKIKSNFTEKLKPLTIENKVAFLDLENILYDKIISLLGRNYDKSSTLNKMIDNTVQKTLLSIKFNYFSNI